MHLTEEPYLFKHHVEKNEKKLAGQNNLIYLYIRTYT